MNPTAQLAQVLASNAGVELRSAASDGKVLLLEVSLGRLSYWCALPLKAVCDQPIPSSRLLAGCCAAFAIGEFLSEGGR